MYYPIIHQNYVGQVYLNPSLFTVVKLQTTVHVSTVQCFKYCYKNRMAGQLKALHFVTKLCVMVVQLRNIEEFIIRQAILQGGSNIVLMQVMEEGITCVL